MTPRRGLVKKYASPVENFHQLQPFFHAITQNGDIHTGVGIMADRADEIESPLARLYHAMFEQESQRDNWKHRLPEGYSTEGMLYHGGHVSHWVKDRPDKYGYAKEHQILHQFAPMKDGNVWVTLHAHPTNDPTGKTVHTGAVVSPQDAEEYITHLSGSGGKWFWAHGSDGQGMRIASTNPITDLRNGIEATTGQVKEPTQMSRISFSLKKVRRYATPYGIPAKNLVTEPVENRNDWMEFKPYPGSTSKLSQHVKVNKNLLPVLVGSRLAVVLHEIRDAFGKHDAELKELADKGLRGVTSHNGQDLFTQIRDKLLTQSQPISKRLGLNHRNGQRAKEIAQNYNWHRVGAGLNVDESVAEYVNKIAKQHLKDRGEQFRSAHNLFGIGSEGRQGAKPGSQDAFLNGLRQHVRTQAIGPESIYGLGGHDVSDQMLLRSLRRLAENEEAVDKIRTDKTINPKTKLPENPTYAPKGKAWSPTKVGGGVRVSPTSRANQFRRQQLVLRYGILDTLRGKQSSPELLEGIRHTSHPNGTYSPDAHMAAMAEHNALRHRLEFLRLLPRRKGGEFAGDHDTRMKEDVNNWMTRLREHVSANANDPDVYDYLQTANKLGHGTAPMGILQLSSKLDPLVKRLSGYSSPHTQGRKDEEGLVDLNESHNAPEEMEMGQPAPEENLPDALPVNTPRQPKDMRKRMYQDIANHEDAGWSSEYPSAVEMLKDKYMIPHKEAVAHVANYRKLKGKPQAAQPTTKRLWPPEKRMTRRRFVRPDEATHNGMIEAIRSNPEDATARLAFANFLQENGIPGSHIVRGHGEQIANGGRIRVPVQTGIASRIMLLGKNRRYAGDTLTTYNEKIKGDVRELPMAQLDYGNSGVNLSVAHKSEPEEITQGHSDKGMITHGITVRDGDHLNQLMSDFPTWAQQEITKLALPHLSSQKTPSPLDGPSEMDENPDTAARMARRRLKYALSVTKPGRVIGVKKVGAYNPETTPLGGMGVARSGAKVSRTGAMMIPKPKLGTDLEVPISPPPDAIVKQWNSGMAPPESDPMHAWSMQVAEPHADRFHTVSGGYAKSRDASHQYLASVIRRAMLAHMGGTEDNTVFHFGIPTRGGYKKGRIVIRGSGSDFSSYRPRLWRRKYAAYRAPSGGMIARGTHYKGGEMIPDMESKFMNPPIKKQEGEPDSVTPTLLGEEPGKVKRWKFDPKRIAKLRAKLSKIST